VSRHVARRWLSPATGIVRRRSDFVEERGALAWFACPTKASLSGVGVDAGSEHLAYALRSRQFTRSKERAYDLPN